MDLSFLDSIGGPRTVGIVAAVLVGLMILKKLLSKPEHSRHLETVRCGSCGWTGSVSKYKPVCPKCAKKIAL
jgi:hypothetical protein